MSRVSILVACAVLLAGCTWTRSALWSSGLTGESAEITAVEKRKRYLDATLKLDAETLRFFFPANYDCTQIIQPGQTVDFGDIGLLPAVRSGNKRCDPVGVLSLEQWAARHGREMTPKNKQEEVTFEVFYRDDELAFARGRFQFAHLAEMRDTRGAGAGGQDLVLRSEIPVVAVIPNSPECQAALAAGRAEARFSEQGPPYTLVSGEDRCAILGMVRTFQSRKPIRGGQTVR